MALFDQLLRDAATYTTDVQAAKVTDVIPRDQKRERAEDDPSTLRNQLLAAITVDTLRDTLGQSIGSVTGELNGPATANVPAQTAAPRPTTTTRPPATTNQQGALAIDDVAQLAYDAGFRGQDLVDIVAIAGRESTYRPTAYNGNRATGDSSYGLTQINMLGSLGPARLKLFGLESADQLFDPATNLRAAYALYRGSGNKLTPWGGYKGKSNTYSTDMNAAYAAVVRVFGGVPT